MRLAAMSAVSGWFVVSAVFMIAVFGLFFTFTERKTWPEHRTELTAEDMRLAPHVSSLWCEALALTAQQPFVAYQVGSDPNINPAHLVRQKTDLFESLHYKKPLKFHYYLLPGSVVQIYSCATQLDNRIFIFKGDKDLKQFLRKLSGVRAESDDSVSLEDSSEENDTMPFIFDRSEYPSLIRSAFIPAGCESDVPLSCLDYPDLRPLHINITEADTYHVVLVGGPKSTLVGVRVIVDRTRYLVHQTGQAFVMCSLATTCTIGLTFASDDRALLYVPRDPITSTNTDQSSFFVRSQCQPRLAVFAIISVFFPLVLFVLVAFVVRADKERLARCTRNRTRTTTRVVEPLIRNTRTDPAEEEHPPSYSEVYDPPPAYASLKEARAVREAERLP